MLNSFSPQQTGVQVSVFHRLHFATYLQVSGMVIILYYMGRSPPTRSVDLVLHALNLAVEYKTINLVAREHLTPEFLKLNPLHTIPLIDDNGFILWESRAIMTYLVSKYGKDDSLYPKDLQQRAIVDQRLHYSNDVFYISKLAARELLYHKKKSIPAELLVKIREVQENVEKLLRGHEFMAGDSLTLADYSYVTLMDVLETVSPTENRCPLTSAWFLRCKTVMKDFAKVNENGASQLKELLKQQLDS
ncbi:hypothetical protein J6590_054266 [Homalodisca vitripennis]|nr:hypothetical protein J6590_054266 [Homalodisca vitripennis]